MQQISDETITKTYNYFHNMKPGDRIEISTAAKKDPALFTDIAKGFIDAGNMDFEFSNDYRFFRRINTF